MSPVADLWEHWCSITQLDHTPVQSMLRPSSRLMLDLQVIKVQKNTLATIQGQAQEQILTGQRELSRSVLAPTIQVW